MLWAIWWVEELLFLDFVDSVVALLHEIWRELAAVKTGSLLRLAQNCFPAVATQQSPISYR